MTANPDDDHSLPKTIAGMDLDGALEMMRGNEKLLIKLLGDFRARYRNVPAEIGALFKEGKIEDARRAAHSLKGVSGNIRANRTFEAARAVEDCLKAEDDGPAQELEALLAELAEALDEVNGGLDAAIGRDA